MKHNILSFTLTLLILSLAAGDSNVQNVVNDKFISEYSNTENPKANSEVEKSKLEKGTGLNFSVGIVIPEYSF